MDKDVFYNWLEHKRERLAQLIREQEQQAGTLDNPQALENIEPRIAIFVGNLLQYLKSGDIQFMVTHLARVIYINVERGQKFDFKVMEKQFQAVTKAVTQVVSEGNFDRTARDQYLRWIERSMANLTSTAGTIYARAVLEKADKSSVVS